MGEGRKDRVGAPGAEADPRNQEQTWGRSAERFGRMEPPSQVDSTSILVGDSGSSLEMQPDHPSPRLTPASTQTPSPSTWRLIPSSLVQLAPQDVGAVVGGGVSGYPVARTRGLAPQPGASSPLAQESQVSGLGRKKKRSAFRNLPGKRPTPKSNSSGSSSGGCGARGPLSSMAHRAGSRRGRLPAVPRLRSKTRARPTSCPAPRPLVPKPCSAACPAGRGGGAGARGCGLRGAAPPGPAAFSRRREGRRGRDGKEEEAGGRRGRTGPRG